MNPPSHEKILASVVKVFTERKLFENEFKEIKKHNLLQDFSSSDIIKTLQKTDCLFEVDMNNDCPKILISIKVKLFNKLVI